jgi:hypothetical protein
MTPAPIYPNVTGPATPAGFADWFIGYGTTVRVSDDFPAPKLARVLARRHIAAALRRWER